MVREPALAGILPVPGYLREPHGDQATSLEGAMGTDVGAVDAVVNLVAEVAAQTQLLGRKAAIEAARAGEVRKLARRPRDSGPEAA
ncbi:MAG: methyl-accepting chemotaxis protein [Thermaerobacter sp.]|nr:methyl-accepting chemotaxis protein [Thermaerobacter sp.]